jgi:hypothetical protein
MNAFQDSDPIQKRLRLGFHAIGNVVTVGMAVFLILVWILASPFLRLLVYLKDLFHAQFRQRRADN